MICTFLSIANSLQVPLLLEKVMTLSLPNIIMFFLSMSIPEVIEAMTIYKVYYISIQVMSSPDIIKDVMAIHISIWVMT